MAMKPIVLTLDKAGRVVLPKALREQFRLRPGSELEVTDAGDHLRLEPRDRAPTLERRGVWWVHGGSADADAALEAAVHRHREERLDDLSR
jgi:AbrB family looped-hinge helix DNA binding protein